MSQITIHNMRNEKPNYVKVNERKVDRGSPLGNPFFMESEAKRDIVCDKYKVWFDLVTDPTNQSAEAKYVMTELRRLLHVYKTCGELKLYCHCTPKRCHAETIREWLIEHSK